MNFLPATDFLLVRPLKENSAGSIVLPTDEKSARKGKVLASGPGRWDSGTFIKNETKTGDTVFYPNYAEVSIRLEDEDLVLVSEKDLLGRLPK